MNLSTMMKNLNLRCSDPKAAFKKIRTSSCSMKFYSAELFFDLFQYTIIPCKKYCFDVLAGGTNYYLNVLVKLQK